MRTSPVKTAVAFVVLVAFIGMGFSERAPAAEAQQIPDPTPQVTYIVSPWSGVYRAGESPGGIPYVEVGSRVEPGTIVGVIEPVTAVPMESIVVPAGVTGTITEALVGDGEMVWVGQPLFRVQLDVSIPQPDPIGE